MRRRTSGRLVLWAGPLALPIALLVGACGDGDTADVADGWAATVDTLPSGRVVVRNQDRPLDAPAPAWGLTERFRVGALEGSGPDVFGDVRDIALGRDGSLHVLDARAGEVRVFGPDGGYRLTLGRPGEGPGELRQPAGLALDGGGLLWVMNWRNARYTAFDPSSGELVEERSRRSAFTSIPWPGSFDGAGRLIDLGLDRDGQPALLRLDTAFLPADTLRLPQLDERHQIVFTRDGRRVMTTSDPLAPRPHWAPHPDGGMVIGEGDVYRIHRVLFGPSGPDTAMTVEIDRPPAPVTDEARDSALADFRETVERLGGAVPDREPRVPDTRPAHGSIFVDDRGRTWVRATPAPGRPATWDVIGRDGRYLAKVAIPVDPGYGPVVVRGGRLGLVTEVDGVPTVIVYRVGEGGGAGS